MWVVIAEMPGWLSLKSAVYVLLANAHSAREFALAHSYLSEQDLSFFLEIYLTHVESFRKGNK